MTKWAAGDRVTVPFVEGCGRCAWCASGNAQVCPDQQQPGFTHWGSFAQYVALHGADVNLVAIPETVSFEAAASLGCRFATAYRALTGRARLQAGEWVTVVGAGGVGLSATMIAKSLGARVIAVDPHAGALDAAKALGADHVLVTGPGRDGVPERVHAITGGGSHVAVDAVGTEEACADSILSLRRRGRHLQVGLLPPAGGQHPRVPMARAIAWELRPAGQPRHGRRRLSSDGRPDRGRCPAPAGPDRAGHRPARGGGAAAGPRPRIPGRPDHDRPGHHRRSLT